MTELEKPPKRYWEAAPKERFLDLKLSHWVELILTLALVGIGYLQFSVYKQQAGLMKTQTDINAAQLEITKTEVRASLGPTNVITNHFVFDPDGSAYIEVVWKNFGNTDTTSDTYIKHGCATSAEPLKTARPSPPWESDPFTSVIYRDEDVRLKACGLGFRNGELDRYVENHVGLTLGGIARYTDVVSKEPHITQYCYVVTFQTRDGDKALGESHRCEAG